MVRADDIILERMSVEGNLTPTTVAQMESLSRTHASSRMSTLTDAGLLERIGPGLYRLTDSGKKYLRGEFDAGGVSPGSG
jgi:predicted transcriptional regulator of viral defense system